MEFVTSRVTLIICGAVLMSVVAVPMSQMFDYDEDGRLVNMVEKDANAVDALMESGYDEMYIRGVTYLPEPGYALSIDGHLMTVTSPEGKTYTAVVSHAFESIHVGYSDVLTVVEEDGVVKQKNAD